MAGYRSSSDGFLLLEALIALAILGLVVVVGLQSVGVGARARVRAAEHAPLRALAENKLADLRSLSGTELQDLEGDLHEGAFEPPQENSRWQVSVSEVEAGTGLFRVNLKIEHEGRRFSMQTYLNRYGELRARVRGERR